MGLLVLLGLGKFTSLLAKLHKTKYKFSPYLADERMRRAKAGKGIVGRVGDGVRFSLYALGRDAAASASLPARKDPSLCAPPPRRRAAAPPTRHHAPSCGRDAAV